MAIQLLTFLSSLLVLSLIVAEEHYYPMKQRRSSSSPHGLFFENPMPFPPSAYDFFHPNTRAATPATAPLPSLYPGETSSRARADAAVATGVFSVPNSGHRTIGAAGGVAGLVVGLLGLVVVLVAVITSFFIVKRRAETKKKTNAAMMINVA